MEQRNLDFGIVVTEDPWDQLREAAAARGPEQGFDEGGDDHAGGVRNRWHELLRESGLHFERGHIPQSGSEEAERFR